MGGNGSGAKLTKEGRALRLKVTRYRRAHPEAGCSVIGRKFGISRQLVHKILRGAGLPTAPRLSTTTRRFYRFQARMRSRAGKYGKHRIAAALDIAPITLWRYELPPDDPRHRLMPERLRERYRKLIEKGT